MASVELDHVTVRSGGSTRLDDVTMTVDHGAVVGVVGGSGSGKTSLLRAVAGLDQLDTGRIRFDGRDVTRSEPAQREVGMVFQTAVLLDHLSSRRNVSFPLDVRRLAADEIRQRVDAEVRALHIEALMARDPSTLSVGEQQMVQIARALVRVPSVLLLDEPLASLDEQLRRRLRAELVLLQSGYGVTTFVATNDSADLDALADVVAVLDAGRVVQLDERAAVRRSPSNLVAAVATGPISLIEATVVADQRGCWLQREDPAGGELVRVRSWGSGLRRYTGRRVVVGIRPEDAEISATGSVPALVERTAQFGLGAISCVVAGVSVAVMAPAGPPPPIGSAVRLQLHHHVVFDRADEHTIV